MNNPLLPAAGTRRRGSSALLIALVALVTTTGGLAAPAVSAIAADTTVTTFDELAAAVDTDTPSIVTLANTMTATANLTIGGNITLRSDSAVELNVSTFAVRVTEGATLTVGSDVTIRQPLGGTQHPLYLESATTLNVLGGRIIGESTATNVYTVNAVGPNIAVNVIGGEVTTVNGRAIYTNTQTNAITLENATATATGTGYALYRGEYTLRGATTTTGQIGGGAELFDFRGFSIAATPTSATYENGDLITLTSSGSGAGSAADAAIVYTTDGSDPATSATATPYATPFPITVGTTVTAAHVKDGYRGVLTVIAYDADNDTQPGVVSSVESFASILVPLGTPIGDIALPTMADVTLVDGRTKVLAISWDTSALDTSVQSSPVLTGSLGLTPYLTNPSATVAHITLHVGESAITDFALESAELLTAGKTNTKQDATIATLSAAGGDSVNYSYALTGDAAGNESFAVSGATLVAAEDLEAGTYAIELTVTSGTKSATADFEIVVAPEGESLVVVNPYEGIDWANVHQLKTALHNHTSNTNAPIGEWNDGVSGTVASRLPVYESLGYGAVAITDHDYVSYPWTNYGVTSSPLIAIPGNEISKASHILGYFSTYRDRAGEGPEVSDGMTKIINDVGAQGGFLYVAHPSRGGSAADPANEIEWFDDSPQIRGIEVLNAGQFTNNHSEGMWDTLLTHYMPERPVYGTSSDDTHSDGMSTIGTGWTYVLTDSVDQKSVRDALASGQTYFSTWRVVVGEDDNKPNPGVPTPYIHGVDVTGDVITLDVSDATTIEWVSAGGQVVATGPSVDVNEVAGVQQYIRARMYGPGGQTMTQPFGLYETSAQDTVDPVITIGLGLPNSAEPGQTLALPGGTATDDRSGAVFTTLTVSTPEGDDVLAIDNRYTFAEEGAYSLLYRAIDGAGNVAEVTKTVTVTSDTDTPPGDGDGDPDPDPTPAPTPDDQLTDDTRGGVTGPDTATAGETVTLTVGEQHSGQRVLVWVHSTPQLLGTFTVSSAGTVTVVLPSDLAAGEHKFVVQTLTGQLVGWTDFTVAADAVPGIPIAGLALTGSAIGTGVVSLGILALLIGGALVVLDRRRKRA